MQVRKDFEQVVDKVFTRANQKNQRMYPATRPTRVSATNQSPVTQQVAVRATPRVQTTKQSKFQPVVSPGMISESAAASSSPHKFVRASDSSYFVGKPPIRNKPSVNTAQSKLARVNSRAGISVLIGGPRDLPNETRPVVSVADQSKLTNPEFDPDLFPRRATQR